MLENGPLVLMQWVEGATGCLGLSKVPPDSQSLRPETPPPPQSCAWTLATKGEGRPLLWAPWGPAVSTWDTRGHVVP